MATKLQRKVWNEHVKAMAASLNAFSIALLIGVFIGSQTTAVRLEPGLLSVRAALGLACQFAVHIVLGQIEDEDEDRADAR